MTKIESNKIELHEEPVRAAELWNSVLPMIEKLAAQKGVRFTARVFDETDEWLLADQQHLNQIAMNLLSNAVKFTPQGGEVLLETHFVERDEKKVSCHILVNDSGIGMGEEFMKKLYMPFEQESGAREGTGLGLAITKKLVDLMGGSISCTSQKNEGTTFVVKLPIKLYTGTEKSCAPEPALFQAEEQLEGKRVLLCEDHPLNTQIAVRLLERRGILTDSATNGQEGLEKFCVSAPGYYDAILMDIRMPVMDGLAAATAIRKLNRPDAKTIPILAMTANAFDEDMEKSRKAGMNAHLSKPIEPQALYEALQHFLAVAAPTSKEKK